MHEAYVDCVEARHRAAAAIYDALQVADVRPPQAHLREASRILGEAENFRKRGDRLREELEGQLS
jgi:hypothetical protein